MKRHDLETKSQKPYQQKQMLKLVIQVLGVLGLYNFNTGIKVFIGYAISFKHML